MTTKVGHRRKAIRQSDMLQHGQPVKLTSSLLWGRVSIFTLPAAIASPGFVSVSFSEALQAINSPDKVIKDWIEEIKREIELQENVRNVRLAHVSGTGLSFRDVEHLSSGPVGRNAKPKLANDAIDVDMTCYTYGHRPDTILNFGGA
ncbi:MAG: hypothetical protein H6750_05585 [Nitrospiraceae bacterium]|nr:hypothetical protein [Nitrospiraceae bacterium]